MLSLLSDNFVSELFPELSIDTFIGDKIQGQVEIGVYSNSVFQGKVLCDYLIDKTLPSAPLIKSSAKSFYSRIPAKISISCPEDSELYISLSKPFSVLNNDDVYTPDSPVFEGVGMSAFRKVSKNTFSLTWDPLNAGSMYYKVLAYSKRGDNTSKVSEYSLKIGRAHV